MFHELEITQQIVYFTFITSFFGMAAGSIYFFSQKTEVHENYRSATIISGVICLVAAMTYFYMKDIYLASALAGDDKFPTVFRYIDWFITVPLMLVKFPSLLGLGKRGQRFMLQLVLASVAMLLTAFCGEVTLGNNLLHFGFYGASCVFWVLIILSLSRALGSLPLDISEAKRVSVRRMFFFILIGWTIYPLGYLAPSIGLAPDIRELVYNIGDVINKVGLGLVIVAGGYRAKTEA